MKKSTLGGLVAVFLIMVILGSVAIYNPSLLNLKQNQLISGTQLYVDPQGSVDGSGNLVSSYWNLLFNIEGKNVIQSVKIDAGTTGQTVIDSISKQVTAGSGIEIDITPKQAYLIRDVVVRQVMIAPGAQGAAGTQNTASKVIQYYDWLEPSFRIYTPYHIDVYKNGAKIGQTDLDGRLNADGTPMSPQQQIPTSDGTIIISNLGGLLGTYQSPAMPSPIAILQGGPYVYDGSTFVTKVDATQVGSVPGANAVKFSDYWFGTSRTSGNLAYNPTVVLQGQITNIYSPSSYGGWEGAVTGGNISPVQPVVFSPDKSALPSDKRSFMSLTEWLENQHVQNLAAAGSSVLSKYASYALVMDNGGSALQINIPWGGYSTPLVTMRVPSEMADTWVERPQLSDVGVSAHWQANNQKSIDLTDQAILAVDLTQKSSVESSARISVSSSDSRVSVYPIQTTETLAPGEAKTILFTVSQTGGTTVDNNVQITINSYNTYDGSLKESDTVSANLLATVGVTSSTLNILFQDSSAAHTTIPALQFIVQYPPSTGQTKTAFSDSNGGATLDISTSAGGGYVGQVTITTEDTMAYDQAYVTTTVHNGQNNVIVTVHLKGTPNANPFDWTLVALIAGIIVAACVIGVIAVKAHKSMKHGQSRVRRR